MTDVLAARAAYDAAVDALLAENALLRETFTPAPSALGAALAAAAPGQTFYLLPDTVYPLTASITLSKPVVLRGLGGQSTVDLVGMIDLAFNAGIDLRDVTIRSSGVDRVSAVEGSNPPLGELDTGVLTIQTAGVASLVNVRIHSLRSAGWWRGSTGTWKGCLLQDIGWDAPDRSSYAHGHALYSQNRLINGTKTLRQCIFVKGYGGNARIYSSPSSQIQGYRLAQCIAMHDSFMVGGAAVEDVQVDDCCLFAFMYFGYGAVVNVSASIRNSVMRGLCFTSGWGSFTAEQNIIFATPDVNNSVLVCSPVAAGTVTCDHNLYISPMPKPFQVNGIAFMTLAEWQTYSGQDLHSAHYTSVAAAVAAGALAVPIVKVYPVDEGDHIANVAIWNPLEAATVAVDLSALALADGTYELRQVRDYDNDVRAIAYTGEPVTVTMSGTTAYPVGYPGPYHPTTIPPCALPTFGAFELWRT